MRQPFDDEWTEERVLAAIAAGRVDELDRHGMSALAVAAYAGRTDLVERLLQAGARLDIHDAARAQRSTGGWFGAAIRKGVPDGAPAEPTGRATLLHVACAGDPSAALIRALLGAGVRVDAPDRFGCTALHLAVWRGTSLEGIRALLEAGADPEARGRAGCVALDHTSDLKLIELLLAHGAKPDGGLPLRWERGGDTILECCAAGGKIAEVEALLRAGALPERHPRALPAAANGGYLELVRLLIAHGFPRRVPWDPSSLPGVHDALAHAGREGYPGIVYALLGPTPDAGECERAITALISGMRPDAVDRARRDAMFERLLLLLPPERRATVEEAWRAGLAFAGLPPQDRGRPGSSNQASAPKRAWPAVALRAHHAKFGYGTLTKIEGSGDAAKLTVIFDDGTTRTLLAKFLRDGRSETEST